MSRSDSSYPHCGRYHEGLAFYSKEWAKKGMLEKFSGRITIVYTEDGFSSCNCILVEDTRTLMIDSAAGRALHEVRPERVDILLNSHHHYDHMGGNNSFPQALKLAHPLEIAAMQDLHKLSAMDAWDEFMHEDCILHAAHINGQPNPILPPWHIDQELHPGDIIDCGHSQIHVIHTPGHTAGHCSFYFPAEDLLFLGDVCLSKVGPWYGGSDSSVSDFITTIDAIRALQPGAIVTGHYRGLLRQDLDAVLVEYRDRILKREERILKYVQENPASIDELASQHFIYAAHPNLFVLYWEKSMLKKHLERLMDLGEVKKGENAKYGV